MNREEKGAVIASLKDHFAQSKATFIINYSGLSVEQMQSLRAQLRQNASRLDVAKARLMKLAAQGDDGAQVMMPYYKGQIGLVFAFEEVPPVAKVLSDFAQDNSTMSVVVGSLDQALLQEDQVQRIGSLPPKEVLLAQVCGTLNAPVAGLVRSLSMMHQKLLWTLKQVGQAKQ